MSVMRFARGHWKWPLGLLLAAVLLSGTVAVIWSWSNAGPSRPDGIPLGDHTYTRALAEHRISMLMKDRHIPGMAAVLILDQEIIWQETFGMANLESETPVSEDTVFKSWSLAKPFTALELMRLVEEGLLDLDAPVETYLPDFTPQSRFPAGDPITLRRLLTHRSGLPRNSCIDETRWHMESDAPERLAESLANCFLAYPTGSRYHYSNVGYNSLGYLIQKQRGQVFAMRMDEQLLAPIGMSTSNFWSPALPADAEMATGYEYYEGEYYPLEQYDIAGIPAGNLYTTIGDLSRFLRFLFREGMAGGGQLMQPETLAAMYTAQDSLPDDPQQMGLGWKLATVNGSEKMVWHDGGPSEGIGALVAFLPERKLGVALLANSNSFEGALVAPLAQELLAAMLETEFGLKVGESQPPATATVAGDVLASYEGSYVAFGDVMEVETADGKLRGNIQGLSFDLLPVGENRFRVSHWLYKLGLSDLLQLPMDLSALEIEFHAADEAGQDYMLINLGGISYEYCPRYPDTIAGSPAAVELAGRYDRFPRLPSGEARPDKPGESEVTLVAGRPHMSGSIGPLLPIDEKTIRILGGPFAGETVTRDPQSGVLYHQGFVYRPNCTDNCDD